MSRLISRIATAAPRSSRRSDWRLVTAIAAPFACDMCQLALPFSPLPKSNVDSFPRDRKPGLQKLLGDSSDCFLCSPAVGILRPLVPENDPTFRVAHDNCVVRQAQQLRLFSYFLLCRFTFREVLDFDDRTNRYVVAKDRTGPIPHREKSAVFADEKVLASHGLPHPYRFGQRAFAQRIGPPIRISMVDLVMHDLPDKFLGLISGDLLHGWIHECSSIRGIHHEKHRRCVICNGP